jgi:hypothetical protein
MISLNMEVASLLGVVGARQSVERAVCVAPLLTAPRGAGSGAQQPLAREGDKNSFHEIGKY